MSDDEYYSEDFYEYLNHDDNVKPINIYQDQEDSGHKPEDFA